MWYGFRFRPDGTDGSPSELFPFSEHPWNDSSRGGEEMGWDVLIFEDDLLLGFAEDGSEDEPEFILYIKKED